MVFLAKPELISFATSKTETADSNSRCEPSGRVITGMLFPFSVVRPTKPHMVKCLAQLDIKFVTSIVGEMLTSPAYANASVLTKYSHLHRPGNTSKRY